MKKLSILAFAMGLIAFTACSEKKHQHLHQLRQNRLL